ncbi:hypothetical protein CAL12_23490 [Bordetella genomosp. 8]|uniref:Oxidoreductase n=1 Tax=Bordetella genomosp. 8 TaxID=1416806 RepID=A0A1W6YR66_9BORD|nr:PDR/VanB family oxidoreductase [Bordetella genomosp. 8]ARP83491.1 hypothetical protein CAL12_23490 [Bordetella genomosp. 8]
MNTLTDPPMDSRVAPGMDPRTDPRTNPLAAAEAGEQAQDEGGWLDVVVRGVRREPGDVLLIELGAPDGRPLPSYAAGAHVAVECGPGVARHYSLCGPLDDAHRYRLGVKVMAGGRGGSAWIGQNAREGARWRISTPRNNFPLALGQPGYLFLSGGIGLTPILAMLDVLRTHGQSARLVHMCRAPEDIAFGPELEACARFHDVHIHCDSAAGGFYDLRAELDRAAADTAVYCCGPTPMMNFVRAHAETQGAMDRFHFEFFAGEVAAADTPFVVELGRSGRRVPVPAGQTMLAALRGAGLVLESGCESGACGACVLDVVSGTPEHRDVYLTAAERASNTLVVPCVSRCTTEKLVIDL